MSNVGFTLGVAEAATGRKGQAALDMFVRQLAIGSVRDRGPEELEKVFAEEFLTLGQDVLLAKFSFANEVGRFKWHFEEPWINDVEEWQSKGATGAVLAGMTADVEFFLVYAGELASVVSDGILARRRGNPDLARWADQWMELANELKIE